MDASYNVHGTRSVQRLIQVCKEPDMVKTIMDALRGHIADLSSHSNGNHVIQLPAVHARAVPHRRLQGGGRQLR